jgi:PPP family 3-phenylpropionic acid transporter
LYSVSSLTRFIILYTALYAAFGVISPFLPVFLDARGLAAEQIATVMALGTAIRLLSAPLAARFSDRHGVWRGLLSGCAAGATVAAIMYLPAEGFWALLLVTLAQSSLVAPVPPIADAVALSASAPASGKGFEYGWVRGAGSAAFIAGSITAGHLAGSLGIATTVWLNAVLLGAAALAALPLPDIAQMSRRAAEQPGGSVWVLLKNPVFCRLLLIAALVMGSHAFHDTFAVIRWHAAGMSTGTASLLWSESVGAEVLVFFLIGPVLVRRFGAPCALAMAAAAGVLRWTVMGASTQIIPLAVVEPLHGFTFALLHLGCMALIAQTVPSRFAATAQALYGTVAVGASTTFLTLGSGWLYGAIGASGFWVMAALCAAAFALARRLDDSPPEPLNARP